MPARTVEPRVAVIDGQRVLVVERQPPVPRTLDRLIAEMRITFRAPIRITGWRTECGREEHRLIVWLEGKHRGLDGAMRSLRLLMCQDCESVCIRDVTHDRLDLVHPSRLPPRRRDHVIGWYSGARRRQRVYG